MAKIEEIQLGDRLIIPDSQGTSHVAIVCLLNVDEKSVGVRYLYYAMFSHLTEADIEDAHNKDAQLRNLLQPFTVHQLS